MKLRDSQRITAQEAESRALQALVKNRGPLVASAVADHIWPGHEMKGQGAGAAASRILKRLERAGKAKWTSTGASWGWIAING